MTKRHVTFVQHLYGSILSDISNEIPELQKELKRDYERLLSALEKHGLRFFTIDLVDQGKHFDKCLSRSRLSKFVGPHTRPYKRGTLIPRLFRGLMLRVFQDTGELATTVDTHSIRFLRQLYYAAKKLKLRCEDDRTYESVRKFFQVEASIKAPSLGWNADCFDSGRHDELHFGSLHAPEFHQQRTLPGLDVPDMRLPNSLLKSLHFVADSISSLIGEFNPYEWRGKHGPGAVSDSKGCSKYEFPHWPKKLELIFPLSEFAYANHSLWVEELLSGEIDGRFLNKEPYTKLIAVPKTQKSPRLIGSEPVAHQWCQQLVKDFLTERLDETPLRRMIHLRDQTFNQRLAKRASIHQSHWTIDLSDASDRLSCWVVERIFRRNLSLLRAFHACRTRLIRNSIDRKSPEYQLLKKFSCMGSALTFPVQSIVYSIVVLACLLERRQLDHTLVNLDALSREALVFGDDLIVPDDVGYLVVGTLRYLGFEVNHNKTFGIGKFRESCGGEYFDGHDVTPTYSLAAPLRKRPESVISAIASRNNFFRSGYLAVAEYLKSTVIREAKIRLPSLPIGSGRLAWDTFGEVDLSGLKSRLNSSLQRVEVKAHELVVRVPRQPDRYASRLLQYFTEAPLPTTLWEGGVSGRPSLNLRERWVPVVR